ncbi:PDZ domain-containing protein [Aliarcobacter butzleri]|uniref:PDZ domain-containing protein n=1 Tax=Aliarcobacter butzleri TaxID=28197 RepID=UPI00342D0C27
MFVYFFGVIPNAYIVTKVNGITIKDFNHFINILDTTNDEYIVIDFIESSKVVLKTKKQERALKKLKVLMGLRLIEG